MQVISHHPSEQLKPYVKHMWIVEENGSFNIDLKSFPTGYSFINVIDGEPFTIINDGNIQSTKSYLAGPKTVFFNLEMNYIRRAFTIQLQPYALPYIFGIPASEFLDEIVPLNNFMPKLAQQLEELIASDIPSRDVLCSIDQLFTQSLYQDKVDDRILHSLQLIMKSKGNIKIKELSNQLNISQRRLQQLFQHNYGVNAKSYSMVVKMQHHTFQILNGKGLNEIIPQGYYDQSHFIHELKKQTGLLPNDFYNYINNDALKMAYVTSNLYF